MPSKSAPPFQLSLFPDAPPDTPVDGANGSKASPPGSSVSPELPAPSAPRSVDPTAVDPEPPGPAPLDAEGLRRRLQEGLGQPVESLTLTRNRTRILSAKHGERGLRVRVHRCFAASGDLELDAITRFFANRSPDERKGALGIIREYFEAHGRGDTPSASRTQKLQPRGRHHDLEELRDRANRTYFDNQIDVSITWGRGAHGGGLGLQHFRQDARKYLRRRRKQTTRNQTASSFHIRLGSYHDRDRLVRIHPVLDQADVPRYVVESIVYHEMLHQAVPPIKRAQRRVVHSTEFRRRERLYAHYEKAEAWLAKNLERLARERF